MGPLSRIELEKLKQEILESLRKEKEEKFCESEIVWKTMVYDSDKLIDDKTYLVRDSRRKSMPPIVAYWDEEFCEFIDLKSLHSYGLNVDEYMEIPE